MENKENEQNKNQEPNVNNKNVGCGIALVIVAVFIIICMILGGNDSSSPKYSDDYYNDKNYRDNVNDVADIYGKDAEEVDRAIQAVADEMN